MMGQFYVSRHTRHSHGGHLCKLIERISVTNRIHQPAQNKRKA